MLTPDDSAKYFIEKLPKLLRSAVNNLFGVISWIFFIESAISIVTGSPFFRSLVIYLMENTSDWIRKAIELFWETCIFMSAVWAAHIKEPTINWLSDRGIYLSEISIDIIVLTVFSILALVRAYRIRTRFDRMVRKSLIPLRKSPGMLYDGKLFQSILKKYPKNTAESDLIIALSNLDKAIVKIFAYIVHFHDDVSTRNMFREAFINVEIILDKTFDVSINEFFQLVYRPVLDEEYQLTEKERLMISEGVNKAIPYIFKDSPGLFFYSQLNGLFVGTYASKISKICANIQLTFVIFILLFVIAVLAAGWVWSPSTVPV